MRGPQASGSAILSRRV